jgi:hypothetical protein
MARANQARRESPSSEQGAPGLEEVIPIAVVVAAGCERCAETMVQRALLHGSTRALIARTLAIVGRVCSAGCFRQAVGPEVVARMEASLQSAQKAALRKAQRWENGQEPPRGDDA